MAPGTGESFPCGSTGAGARKYPSRTHCHFRQAANDRGTPHQLIARLRHQTALPSARPVSFCWLHVGPER